MDEWVEFTRCGGRENCREGQRCLTHHLWDQLSDEIFRFLSDITLQNLVERGAIGQVDHHAAAGIELDADKHKRAA